MKRAERPLYPLRRTKGEDRAPADDALAFECRTAATFDRLRIGHLARRLALGPPVRVLTIYQLGKKENTGTGDQTDVHCHEPVSREKRFRGRV